MNMNIEEKILLYAVRTKNDPEAYGKLYDLYIDRVYRFVLFKISHKEQAEDLTSEIFLKAWRYLIRPDEKSVKHFRGFIYQITRNTIIDWYRERAKKQEFSLDSVAEAPARHGSPEQIADMFDANLTLELLKKLKQEYQEVIFLKYVEGFSTADIARIVGKKPTAVRVTLHRAIKKLKSLTP